MLENERTKQSFKNQLDEAVAVQNQLKQQIQVLESQSKRKEDEISVLRKQVSEGFNADVAASTAQKLYDDVQAELRKVREDGRETVQERDGLVLERNRLKSQITSLEGTIFCFQ